MSLTPRLPAVGPTQAEDRWGVRRSAPFILSTIVVGHCKPEGMTRSGLPWNAPRKSKAWKQASKAWRIKAGPPAEATYSGTDRARGARRPLCDEGTSHLKTQINYSFPTNEQPPGSGTSHRTAPQTAQASANRVGDTARRADAGFLCRATIRPHRSPPCVASGIWAASDGKSQPARPAGQTQRSRAGRVCPRDSVPRSRRSPTPILPPGSEPPSRSGTRA